MKSIFVLATVNEDDALSVSVHPSREVARSMLHVEFAPDVLNDELDNELSEMNVIWSITEHRV